MSPDRHRYHRLIHFSSADDTTRFAEWQIILGYIISILPAFLLIGLLDLDLQSCFSKFENRHDLRRKIQDLALFQKNGSARCNRNGQIPCQFGDGDDHEYFYETHPAIAVQQPDESRNHAPNSFRLI